MKIATWNINSVRLRIDLVMKFLNDSDIDVLCLQETKTEDRFFPAAALAAAGWSYHAFRGEKSYNGVAIVSRLPLGQTHYRNWAEKTDCRHICRKLRMAHRFIISTFQLAVTCLTARRIQNSATSWILLPR